jgi:hypothetical protein
MSDTIYNTKHYVTFKRDEMVAFVVSSVCIAFILSARELLFTHYGEAQGFHTFALTALVVLVMLLAAAWTCKLVGIRIGHVITYRAHIPGLVIGIILSVISAGYLPVFLPGGFVFDQPTRLRIGKWLGYQRGWEIGLISGTFPLVVLLFVLVLSPLYLLTKAQLYVMLMIAASSIAFGALIPAPFFQKRNKDWYRSLRGSTFGLDVAYSSPAWYIVLTCAVIIFIFLTYLLTIFSVRVEVFIYMLSLLLGLVSLFVYRQFFKH